MKLRQLFFLLSFLCLVILLVPEADAQCAMCRATVENNVTTGKTQVGAGLNKGILYLVAMPYLLFGIMFYFWRKQSRLQQQQKRLLLDFGENQDLK